MAKKNKSVKRKKSADIVRETISKWENMDTIKKKIKKKNSKWTLGPKKKGCMKGKGGPRNSSHQFRGVRQRTCGKWVAEIREPKCNELDHYVPKRLWLGTFQNEVDAAKAYDQAAKAIYGDTAILNFPESRKDDDVNEVLNVMKEVNLDVVETEMVVKGDGVECVKEEIFGVIDEGKIRDGDEECVEEGKVDEKDGMGFRDFRAGVEDLRQESLMEGKAVEGAKNLDFDFLREFLKEDFNDMEHLVMDDQDLLHSTKDSCGNWEDLQQERLSDHNPMIDITDGSQNLVTGDKKDYVGEFENVVCNDETDESWKRLARYKDYIKELRRPLKPDEIENLLTGDMGDVEEHKKFVCTDETDEIENLLTGDTDYGEEHKKFICTDETDEIRNLLTGETDYGEEHRKFICIDETDEIRNLLTGDTNSAQEFKKLFCTGETDASRNLLKEDVDYREELKQLFCTDETDASRNLLKEDVDYGEELKKLFCTDEPAESQNLLAGDTGYIEESKKVDRTDEYNEQGDGKIDLNHLDLYNDDPLMNTERSLGISCYSSSDDEIYIGSLWSE